MKDREPLDQGFIERLVQLFEHSSLAELDYTEGASRLRLSRGNPAAPRPEAASPAQAPAPPSTPQITPTQHLIQASFPGVFYRSATPGEPPLVQVGEQVKDGQTLGLLEAMKLFNRVQADAAGRIIDIPAQDGATVAPGATLFILDVSEQE